MKYKVEFKINFCAYVNFKALTPKYITRLHKHKDSDHMMLHEQIKYCFI